MNSSTPLSRPVEARRRPRFRFVAIGVCASIAIALAGWFLEKATERYDFSEPKLIESLALRDKQLDLVYLGSSLPEEGVDAEAIDAALGTSSYNLAFGGASLLNSELQLRQFLESNPAPRLVALGLYINVGEKTEAIPPTLYFGISPEVRKLFRQRLLSDEGAALDPGFEIFSRIPAYRYRNTIDLLIKAMVSREDVRPRFVQGQARVGFSRLPVVLTSQPHDSLFNLKSLRHFLDLCAERKLRVFLFEPPNHAGYSALTANRAKILSQVNEEVRATTNASFQSFNDEASSGEYLPMDWVNLNHLNERGAKKFSARLARSIGPLLR
jgi:hypothetical protein